MVSALRIFSREKNGRGIRCLKVDPQWAQILWRLSFVRIISSEDLSDQYLRPENIGNTVTNEEHMVWKSGNLWGSLKAFVGLNGA